MEFISYNAELALANLAFSRPFSNISIERTSANGQQSWLKVQCIFGQRSRVLKNLENASKRGNMKLPLIVINRTGYSRNPDRLNNINNEVKYEISSKDRRLQLLTPVPIDIDYEVSVVAKYPSDIDKIASNFMVFFNPDIFVSIEHPKYKGIQLNNQIVMQDSVSEDHSDEQDGTTDDFTTATFNFTYRTYLFAGTRQNKAQKNKYSLSTILSTIIEPQYNEITYDKIDDFQTSNPTESLYQKIDVEKQITAQVSVYNNDISDDDVYDDVPTIKKIDFGIYPVPNKYDMISYMQSVDNELFVEHSHSYVSGYISSENYISAKPDITIDPSDETQISQYNSTISTENDYYDKVDWDCTLMPYVDRMKWIVDTDSTYSFPNNTILVRD